MSKICPICKESFEPHRAQKYCSDKCASEAKRRWQREYQKRHPRTPKTTEICPICKEKFVRRGTRKYCSDLCSYKAKQRQHAEKNRLLKEARSKKDKRICLACKKEFEPTAQHRVYCSDECEEKARYDFPPKVCPICHETFYANHGQRKYCSDACYTEAARRRNIVYQRELHKVHKQRFRITCPVCGEKFYGSRGRKYCSEKCRKKRPRSEKIVKVVKPVKKSLEEWIREARECNLDYGTYRALINTGKTFDELKALASRRIVQAHAHAHKGGSKNYETD